MLNYDAAKEYLVSIGVISCNAPAGAVIELVNKTIQAAATPIVVPEEETVHIWTDGSCRDNPGIGGYAAVMLYKNHRREISGADQATTNNRMELSAVIEALKALKKPSAVVIHSDSAYVLSGIENMTVWRRRGWKTASGGEAKNVDLWQQLDELLKARCLSFKLDKVKGHGGVKENERCDQLAKAATATLIADLEMPKIPEDPNEVA